MEITPVKVTRNNTLRGIPITNRYLIRRGEYEIFWNEYNDQFKFFANTGGNRQVTANVQADESEHSPDLFLYTNMGMYENYESERRIVKANREQIHYGARNWYIRQLLKSDRVGPKRFTGLPLRHFFNFWRVPIDPKSIEKIKLLGNNRSKIFFDRGPVFSVYYVWPELEKDMNRSNDRTSQIVLPWLQKHCKNGIFLFSDYDSMFKDKEEELCYMADIA